MSLDEDLRYAKAHQFKVELDFDRRFRVWRDMILFNRKMHLLRTVADEEFESLKKRYMELDKLDAIRLKKRAKKEFDYVCEDIEDHTLFLKHRQVFIYRQDEVNYLLNWQRSRYAEIRKERYKFRSHVYIYEHIFLQLKEGDKHGKED